MSQNKFFKQWKKIYARLQKSWLRLCSWAIAVYSRSTRDGSRFGVNNVIEAISTSGVRRLVLLGCAARVETNLWTFHHIFRAQTRTLTATCTRVSFIFIVRTFRSIDFITRMMCWSESVVFRRFCKFFSFPETILLQFSDEVFSPRARRLEAEVGRRLACKKSRFVNKTAGEEEEVDVKLRNCSSESIELQRSRDCLIC